MKNSSNPKRSNESRLLTSAATAMLISLWSLVANAADISWTDGTASYTNAANWTGGVVPGTADNAINDNGSNNVVQINAGDPDWTLNGIRAGNSTGNGAFAQSGQTV